MSKEMFDKYRGAMAYIEVKLPNGDVSIGSAFHVGAGVFVTARHVLENNQILSMATTERYFIPEDNGGTTLVQVGADEKGPFSVTDPQKYRSVFAKELNVTKGPFFHPNPKVDVGALVVSETDITVIPLGDHLDDWIIDSDFTLAEVLVMGYPPIPMAKRPILFAVRGEINAVVDRYDAPHVHFVVSGVPRGGFSGGLCMTNIYGGEMALGVVVNSIVKDNQNTESGFLTVLTIEPIHVCLQQNKIVPSIQDFWLGDIGYSM